MDEGAAYFLAFVFGAVLFFFTCGTLARRCERYDGYESRCKKQCAKSGEVFARESGACTCRDGTVWVWQEGYSRKLGGAGK